MLELSVSTDPLSEADADVLLVGAFAPDDDTPGAPPVLAADAERHGEPLVPGLADQLAALGFAGAIGTLARIPLGDAPGRILAVVGLGSAAQATTTVLRRACAQAVAVIDREVAVATALHEALDPANGDEPATGVADAVQAVAEGAVLGTYRYTPYRAKLRAHALSGLVVHVGDRDADGATTAVERARVGTSAAWLVRDLVNTPPQDKRPTTLAERSVAAVADLPIATRVLDEAELAAGGYGGIVGVGQGSAVPPRLVELRYAPEGAVRHVALVGKGITFDTGGLSLKPSASMETMKLDMAGAASVLGAIRAVAERRLPIAVTALLALAENMPSGTATRVSDVLTMRDGTTVEVINTDAEGRLVLADALAHACEAEPDVIVDVATLTGAAVVALGDRIGVVIANDDELSDALVRAGERAGEPLWPLPLAREAYGERVEGTFADLRNVGGRAAGTIFGALFLERFVANGVAWAHLDVAGTAWTDDAYGEFSKGGTGVPVRTLVEWIATLAD